MATFLKRREFLTSSSAFAAVVGLPASTSEMAQNKWFRGNLHMHTLLSDGQAFPDEAALLYKRMGYDFVVFSDHNKVHEDGNVWVNAKNRKSFKPESVANFKKYFPNSGILRGQTLRRKWLEKLAWAELSNLCQKNLT